MGRYIFRRWPEHSGGKGVVFDGADGFRSESYNLGGGGVSCFLGALGGDGGLLGGGDLVGDGDGDLTGESEKGFLTKEDLADDFCLDWDLDGGGRLDWVSCCGIGVSAGGLEDLEDDGLGASGA